MSETRSNGARPVPFRRLVRTASSGWSQPAPMHHQSLEAEYEYGCVEWYQYPTQSAAPRSGETDARTRLLGR